MTELRLPKPETIRVSLFEPFESLQVGADNFGDVLKSIPTKHHFALSIWHNRFIATLNRDCFTKEANND